MTKVHIEVTKYAREGTEAILIGHEGHPEVEGTMGQYDKLKVAIFIWLKMRLMWQHSRLDIRKN